MKLWAWKKITIFDSSFLFITSVFQERLALCALGFSVFLLQNVGRREMLRNVSGLPQSALRRGRGCGHLVGKWFQVAERVDQGRFSSSYWKGQLATGAQSIWRPSKRSVEDAQTCPLMGVGAETGAFIHHFINDFFLISINYFLIGWGTGNCRFRKEQPAGDLQGRRREYG